MRIIRLFDVHGAADGKIFSAIQGDNSITFDFIIDFLYFPLYPNSGENSGWSFSLMIQEPLYSLPILDISVTRSPRFVMIRRSEDYPVVSS